MNQNPHWKQLIWNWASIIFGNALYSLAVALFLEPAGLITGGATGIALAIGRLTGLSVSGLLFFINLAMLVWGWVVLGRAFALNTLASSVLSPAFLALFEGMANGRVLTEDIFLCTVFAGLGIGVSLGIVIRSVHPPAVSTSRRWCSTNGSSCRCRPPCWFSTSWSC